MKSRNRIVPLPTFDIFLLFVLAFSVAPDTGCEDAPPRSDLILRGIVVPGNQTWTRTDVHVQTGEPIVITEEQSAQYGPSGVDIRKGLLSSVRVVARVTARGSYTVKTRDREFPLPSVLDDAPFPAYCLMGRIGETGEPFYVGPRYRGEARSTGELYLGINDPNPAKNRGAFVCKVILGDKAKEDLTARPRVVPDEGRPLPIPNANVVIFFVDGLRPDVVVEMARMGHMPTFNQIFLTSGTHVRNTFTGLPSLTQISFASMMTGTFSDKHGSKMNFYYDRKKDRLVTNLDKFGYPRIAAGVRRRGVKALYDYFPNTFGAGALPMQPRSPKEIHANLVEWGHRAVNVANYASNAEHEIDKVQARFGMDLASMPEVRVMLIWLPHTDVESEKHPHGQFGRTRAAVAGADEAMATVVRQLKRRGRFAQTYFVLFSDHGTVGGNGFVNRHFDVDREILHAHFALNTKGYYNSLRYPGTPRRHFAAVADGDGAVEIYLPHRRADSADLTRPNFLSDLQNYKLADGTEVDAMEVFTEYTTGGRIPNGDLADKPVDFAVARADGDSVFIQRTTKSQAFIRWRRRRDGELEFRYEPVRSGDPLQYLDSRPFREALAEKGANVEAWLSAFHTGREWLQVTAGTRYPGCVDGIARFFYCDDRCHEADAGRNLPDILLFAGRGWTFIPRTVQKTRGQEIAGTRHGMAFDEATRICAFFSGPGIRRGCVIEEPHRIVDILPTVLTMMSTEWRGNGIDGVPINGIWEKP